MQTDAIGAPAETGPGEAGPRGMDRVPARAAGALLLIASLAWGASATLWDDAPAVEAVHHAASGLLLLGMLAVVVVIWRTGAVGPLPGWRASAAIAGIVAAIAAVAMLALLGGVEGPVLVRAHAGWFAHTAAMMTVSIGVVAARVWRAPLRYLPLITTTWPVILYPMTALFGESAGWVSFVIFLVTAHGALALALLLRPELTSGGR